MKMQHSTQKANLRLYACLKQPHVCTIQETLNLKHETLPQAPITDVGKWWTRSNTQCYVT